MRRPMRKSRPRHSRSKATDAAWAAGRSSQRPLQGSDLLEGHVGGVGHGPVGVAVLVVLGEVAVQPVAVGQPVGADDARVADVDDVGVRDVEPDAKADEEEQPDDQPRRRHEQAQRIAAAAAPQPDPQHAREQVDQQRIGERHRDVDVGVVEEGHADPEGHEHGEVEVAHPQQPAPIDERHDEEQRERDPHERRVDLAPERAGVAAGHRPRHLRPRPRLRHATAVVADVDLRDLLRVLAARDVVADLPARARLLEDVGERRRAGPAARASPWAWRRRCAGPARPSAGSPRAGGSCSAGARRPRRGPGRPPATRAPRPRRWPRCGRRAPLGPA